MTDLGLLLLGKQTVMQSIAVLIECKSKPSEAPLQGNVQELPFANETFDLATAFETIYFWSDIDQSFSQIYRVLKKGGIFMVCNESNGENDKDKKWTEIIKGMKIYTSKEIKYSLEKAGFTHIETNKNAKGWLCVVARK